MKRRPNSFEYVSAELSRLREAITPEALQREIARYALDLEPQVTSHGLARHLSAALVAAAERGAADAPTGETG